MNLDLARKTELIRRKIKTIIFDRKNRRLSDQMYSDLGKFFEKVNKEGVLISDENFDKLNGRLDKLEALNSRRIDELNKDMDKDMRRLDQQIAKQQQSMDAFFNAMGVSDTELTDEEFNRIIGR